MKRKSVSITTNDNEESTLTTINKRNKLNFLFDNNLIQDIMHYRGLTNYSEKRIPFSPKSLFRFFVNPNGLDTNDHWYLRINNLVQKNPQILLMYHLPKVSASLHFNNPFNVLQHQANSIELVDDFKIDKENGEKLKDVVNLVDSFQFNACQTSAYEKIVGLSLLQNFSVVALVGPAGTGKTYCLKQFIQKQLLFTYITIQNNLLQDATIKLGLNGHHAAFTLCRFIMNLFDLNFYQQCTLNNTITGYQVQDFSRLFNQLPVSVEFVRSLLLKTRDDKEQDTSENSTLFLCIDEFSMVSCNILTFLLKGLEHAIKCLNAVSSNNVKYKIVVLLCGDCHQIQPIFTMKTDKLLQRNEMVKRSATLDDSSRYQHISTNCRNILKLVNEKIFFFQQLRNNNASYLQFLDRILTVDNWQLEIVNYFNRRCLQKEIHLHYPIKSIVDLSMRENKNPIQKVEWYRKHLHELNKFNYFTWCNVDAHFINLSVFYSIYRTFFSQHSSPSTLSSQETARHEPRLAPIYFYANSDFHNGCFDCARLPFLPLVLGMTYKVLINKANTLFRGQLLTLVDINDANGECQLTCIDRNEKLYKIKPTFFTMNLFCQDASSHFVFQNMDKIAINNAHCARMQKYGKLFGYPLQMVCGDTVRASIGITVDGDMYVNLNGCSLEEIYVILSRTTNQHKIKAVHIS